jgi:alkylation response protein AidB-like acyl-CoA dehydrogenase
MFAETEDQQLFGAATRRLLDTHDPVERCGRSPLGDTALEPSLWREAAQLGWPHSSSPTRRGAGRSAAMGSPTLVGDAVVRSVTRKMQAGALPHHAAAMLRLFSGRANVREAVIALELAGRSSVGWAAGKGRLGQVGTGYLGRQASSIGGGTTEMARNVISKRLLGMPGETRADGGPFRDVARGAR